MASGRIDTMSDYLRKIMQLLAEAKVVADADLPFLLEMEQLVVGKLRDPVTRMQQAGIMPNDPNQIPAGGGQMAPPPGAPDPSMLGSMPMQSGGLSAGPGAPNADELRRIIGQRG